MRSERSAPGIQQKRLTQFVAHVSVLSLLSFPLGCGSESQDKPNGTAGTSGSTASAAGAPTGSGAGAGGSTPGSGGGAGTQTGGGGAGTGNGGAGPLAGTGGALGGGAPAVGGAGSGPVGAGAGGFTSSSGGMATGGVGGAAGAGAAAGMGGAAGATSQTNPLAHLADSAKTTGLLLANRFSKQALAFSSVANLPGDGYKTACEWYGALGVAKLTSNQDLLTGLVTKFEPLKANFVSAMTGGEAHVDRYIFGMVPLEIYLQTGDESYLPLGTQVADKQQTTNQTRDAIDDMFMMTILQVQAYRATKQDKYLTFMADIMVDYLGAQQANGLFFHNVTEARVHWGRGNGWFAAGMAEMMRDLPTSSANYQTIEAGYKKMMDGLRKVQGKNGLWYQVLDMPDNASNWEESSGSAMFTYAMIAGVRRGILDAATYVPVIEAAWAGLQKKISAQGDVSDICVGTWYKASAAEYMALTRLTGDGHGQAPVLWAAAELLR
jgi:unsaturated rhamnogalacturonyl hydrolase